VRAMGSKYAIVLTLHLPKGLYEDIEKLVRMRRFLNKSEAIRYLICKSLSEELKLITEKRKWLDA